VLRSNAPRSPELLYALNHTWGVSSFTTIYFIALIMFGSFFMLNLALAVIWSEYAKAGVQITEKVWKLHVCPLFLCPFIRRAWRALGRVGGPAVLVSFDPCA
jgi:hypothetical protein